MPTIKVGEGSGIHLQNCVATGGFSIEAHKSATVTMDNMTVHSPGRPATAARAQSRSGQTNAHVGWTRATRGAFDPRATATITDRLGANPFDDPKELIDHTRDHIENLEARVKAFFDGKPYAAIIEADTSAGQQVHKVKLTDLLPRRAATVAKDVFTNIRDTLDHAVQASAATLRPGRRNLRTGFPFALSAAGVHDKLNGELIDVPPEIRTLLEAFGPHQAGNQMLWGLNCTRNVETHRIIVPLLAASIGNSQRVAGTIVGDCFISHRRWDAANNEVEYLRVGIGSDVQYELNVAFDVLLGDVEVLGGKSAITTLYEIAREVESVVLAIEAETARLLRSTN